MGRFHDEATTVLLICFLSKCHLNIEIENASAYTPGSKANGREGIPLQRKCLDFLLSTFLSAMR